MTRACSPGRSTTTRCAKSKDEEPCGALPHAPRFWAARRSLTRAVGERFWVGARCGFAGILDVGQEAAAQPRHKRFGERRRHTAVGTPHRKKSSKTFDKPRIPLGIRGELFDWAGALDVLRWPQNPCWRTIAVVVRKLSGQGGLYSLYAWRIQVPNREIYGASVTASDPLIRHNRHEKHNTPAADHVEDEILHPSGVQNDKV